MSDGVADEAEARLREAEAEGNTNAMSDLGVLIEERGADAEAEEWYRRAAEEGNAEAMFSPRASASGHRSRARALL